MNEVEITQYCDHRSIKSHSFLQWEFELLISKGAAAVFIIMKLCDKKDKNVFVFCFNHFTFDW